MTMRPPLHCVDGRITAHGSLPGEQFLLTIEAPLIARTARPGHFVQVDCGPRFTLRRPFSLLDANPEMGTIQLLYKRVGAGTAEMSRWRPGELVGIMGPIGEPFEPATPPLRAVLIGGGVGLAPVDWLARELAAMALEPVLFYGSESDAPFPTAPSVHPLAGVAEAVTAGLTRLEAHGVATRLAALSPRAGWFQGYVTDLAAQHLAALPPDQLANTRLYACGPTPMLKAVAALAARFNLGGQLSLEERMACGFGGCAGCVTPVKSASDPDRWENRRVCVDGPVFPIGRVFEGV